MAEKNERAKEIAKMIEKNNTNKSKNKKGNHVASKTTNSKKVKNNTEKKSENKKTNTAKHSKKSNLKETHAVKNSKKNDKKVKKLIAEQIANMDKIEQEESNKESNQKNEKKKYNPLDVEKKLEEQKKLPPKEKNIVYKKMFINVIIAIIISIYIIFLNLGAINIESNAFQIDLKVFSMCLIVLTITIFEIAYKKDSGSLALKGVEILVLSIITLGSIYIYILYSGMYISLMNLLLMLIDIYYISKITYIYIKRKKEYKNNISDVKELVNE